MSKYYFFEPEAQQGFLNEEESHHASRVLRLNVGQNIVVLDGRGQVLEARITELSPKKCFYQILNSQNLAPKSHALHLWMAPTKQMERMEWLMEKGCEMGLSALHFFHSKHSERKEIKLHRLEKIAVSALKQSKHGYLPQLTAIQDLRSAVKVAKAMGGKPYLAQIGAPQSLFSWDQTPGIRHVFIGPEGDFSAEELSWMQAEGVIPGHMGTEILRTETAALLVCAAHKLLL